MLKHTLFSNFKVKGNPYTLTIWYYSKFLSVLIYSVLNFALNTTFANIDK